MTEAPRPSTTKGLVHPGEAALHLHQEPGFIPHGCSLPPYLQRGSWCQKLHGSETLGHQPTLPFRAAHSGHGHVDPGFRESRATQSRWRGLEP